MPSPREEAEEIASGARGVLAQTKRRIRMLLDRHHVYSRTFLRDGGKPDDNAAAVLDDLARFCAAETSTYHDDPRRHAMMEGRRQVFLHISSSLKLDQGQIAALNRQVREYDDE